MPSAIKLPAPVETFTTDSRAIRMFIIVSGPFRRSRDTVRLSHRKGIDAASAAKLASARAAHLKHFTLYLSGQSIPQSVREVYYFPNYHGDRCLDLHTRRAILKPLPAHDAAAALL